MTDRPPLERRGLEQAPAVDTTGARPALVGYAIRFGELSEPLARGQQASFRELVRPEALRRLPERRDVKALVNHEPARVVGSSRGGSLQLTTDAIGLRFRLDPPDSPSGADLVEAVRRGDLDGVSIGFRVLPGGETWRRDVRPPVRELVDIDLFELSFVSWPAYAGAGVSIEQRALDEAARINAADQQQTRRAALLALERRLQPEREAPGASLTGEALARQYLAIARAILKTGADRGAILSADDLERLRTAAAAAASALALDELETTFGRSA